MSKRFALIAASLALSWSCNNSDFAGDSDKAAKVEPKAPPKDLGNGPKNQGSGSGKGSGSGSGSGKGSGSSNGAGSGKGSGKSSGPSSAGDENGEPGSEADLGSGKLGDETDTGSGVAGEPELGFDDAEVKILPKPCDGSNQVIIGVGQKCPASMAMYTMDDMSSKAVVPSSYVCCGLPSGDVLSKKPEEMFQTRNRTCAPNEVMTGVADGNGAIMCTKINLDRYQLGPAKLVCAGEQGVLGFGGKDCGGSAEIVDKNTMPPNIRNLVIGPLGEDGCVSYPYGALVIQQGGRRCEDSAAMALYFNVDGQPVPMFP